MVASICFICSASFKLKLFLSADSFCFAFAESLKNFLSDRKIKYSISTVHDILLKHIQKNIHPGEQPVCGSARQQEKLQ